MQNAVPAFADKADSHQLNEMAKQSYLDGEDAQAKVYFEAAIDEAMHSTNPEPSLSISYFGLAQMYYMQQKYALAEEFYSKALSIDEKLLPPDDPVLATRIAYLAAADRHLGRLDKVEPLLLRVLSIREKSLGSEDPLVGNSLLDLTVLYVQQGRYSLAEPLCKRAVSIKEKTLGLNSVRLIPPLKMYADLLRKLDRAAEASGVEARSNEIETKLRK